MTNQSLQQEVAALQQQVANLTAENTRLRTQLAQGSDDEPLREQYERLQMILDGSSDGAWDANLVTGEAYTSNRYHHMLGYEPGELPPTVDGWLQQMHPDDVEAVQQTLGAYIQGHLPRFAAEYRLRHKSGEWRWMLSRGKTVAHDEQGNTVRIAGTITDVTRRKQIEDELHIFQALVANSPDPVGLAAMDGTITYANAAQQEVTGYGQALTGMNIAVLYPPEYQEALVENMQLMREQGMWQGQLHWLHKDGSLIPIYATAFVMHDESGDPFVVALIGRDMRAQQQAEAERNALQEQVINAQRNSLRALSTPLIPIAAGVVVMPLIGVIDSRRAQQVMETLLEGIAAYQADTAILDITGVDLVDTQVADGLIRAARAVRLLGAQAMLTGIQPAIAQTLVHLGVDLSDIQTHGNLQTGIAHALHIASDSD